MRKIFLPLLALMTLGLFGCSKSTETATTSTTPGAPVQTASLKLKDGGKFSGKVRTSDATAITIEGDNGEVRTYPMSQVASVQYGTETSVPAAAPLAITQPNQVAPAPPMMPPPASVRPPEELLTVPAGTTLEVRNNDTIDSATALPNQTYTAVLTRDLMDDRGRVAAPKGANATLIVRQAADQGKMQGRSELVLDVASVEVDGRKYRVETKDLVEQGKQGVGTNKRTAVFTGGGAALGSIIGAIAGGGKGAAIGAAAGAGAGIGTQAVTRGKAVKVPSETILRFTIEQPVQIRLVQ